MRLREKFNELFEAHHSDLWNSFDPTVEDTYMAKVMFQAGFMAAVEGNVTDVHEFFMEEL